jgi:hypothetical protein
MTFPAGNAPPAGTSPVLAVHVMPTQPGFPPVTAHLVVSVTPPAVTATAPSHGSGNASASAPPPGGEERFSIR